jgi:hypothetical protein
MTSKSYTRAQGACKGDQAWQPGRFTVFVWVDIEGDAQPHRFRIGGYRTLAEARVAIADDRAAFRDRDWTLGGLIDWGTGKPGARHYRIFKASSWLEVR